MFVTLLCHIKNLSGNSPKEGLELHANTRKVRSYLPGKHSLEISENAEDFTVRLSLQL
jgi:hypothetical protein